MSTRWLARSFVVAALFGATDASPQSALPYGLAPPYDGAYFDPAQPGIGLWLDNGPDGTTFGALMYYAPDGRPTFATFASPLGSTGSPGESSATLRGLRGPLYETRDGQCVGCPYRAPSAAPLGGDFRVDVGHRAARVTWRGAHFDMGAIPFGRSDPALLEGTWWLALDDVDAVGAIPGNSLVDTVALQAVVRIAPVTGVRFASSPGASGLDDRYAEPNLVVHEVTCIASCGDFERWRLATGPSTRVFAHGRASTNPDVHAAFGRYIDTDRGYAIPPDGRVHDIDPDPYVVHSILTTNGAPRLTLYRSPVTAPCDGGTLCVGTDDTPGLDRTYESDGDRWAWLTRGSSGAYFDPRQSGTGLWVDVGRDGRTFMALMTYAARGDGGSDPVFYTLGGPIQLLPLEGLISIPAVRSPVYESRNGQAIGQPWQPPTTRVATALGEAKVWLYGADGLRLDLAGHRYDMVALNADRTPNELPRGRWLLMLRDQLEYDGLAPAGEPYARTESVTAIVELVPSAFPFETVASVEYNRIPTRPAAGAVTYEARCVSSCGDFDAWRRGSAFGAFVQPGGATYLTELAFVPGTGFRVADGARQYLVEPSDETLSGYALRLAVASGRSDVRTVNRGAVRLHRNPPHAFCDTDATCR